MNHTNICKGQAITQVATVTYQVTMTDGRIQQVKVLDGDYCHVTRHDQCGYYAK
jgi:hypothetical protein